MGRVAGTAHRLSGCDAVVEGVMEDGGWPALKISLTTELGDVNVVTIACSERGVRHVRVDGEYLLGGASELTAYGVIRYGRGKYYVKGLGYFKTFEEAYQKAKELLSQSSRPTS